MIPVLLARRWDKSGKVYSAELQELYACENAPLLNTTTQKESA